MSFKGVMQAALRLQCGRNLIQACKLLSQDIILSSLMQIYTT